MTAHTAPSTREESYLVIGDGIAGSSAAATLAEQTDDASITVLTAEDEPLYNRILIKEYAKGDLPEPTVRIHDESWYADRGIDLHLGTRVTDVDTATRTVETDTAGSFAYDDLLIATGGTPRQLPVPNAHADGVTSFWTLEDATRIRRRAESADTGTIVGAGLLGIDYAAIASAQDVDAHYLIREDKWLPRAMSDTGASIVHDALRDRGVTPVFDTTVERFETDDDGQVARTVTADGTTYESDCVGVAIGTEPNTQFLAETPIPVDGGVVVDAHLRTDVPHVYAAGDVARYFDRRLGQHVSNGSWDSAQAQGELVAKNMLAARAEGEPFAFVPSYTVAHFEFPLASFGHPGLGETYVERRYDDTEWRRLAFKDGMLVGGILIGDLAPLQAFKKLTASGRRVVDDAETLLERTFEYDDVRADSGVSTSALSGSSAAADD